MSQKTPYPISLNRVRISPFSKGKSDIQALKMIKVRLDNYQKGKNISRNDLIHLKMMGLIPDSRGNFMISGIYGHIIKKPTIGGGIYK